MTLKHGNWDNEVEKFRVLGSSFLKVILDDVNMIKPDHILKTHVMWADLLARLMIILVLQSCFV